MKLGPSIISQDLVVEGDLTADGEVHVEGELKGRIRAQSVTLGESAVVRGEIRAEEVIVRGRIEGDICGERVQLAQSARVEGDIVSKTLSVETGAFFQGSCHHEEDPVNADLPRDGRPPLMLSQSLQGETITPGEPMKTASTLEPREVLNR